MPPHLNKSRGPDIPSWLPILSLMVPLLVAALAGVFDYLAPPSVLLVMLGAGPIALMMREKPTSAWGRFSRGFGFILLAIIAGLIGTQMAFVIQDSVPRCRALTALMPPNARTAGADTLEIERQRLAIDSYNAQGCRHFMSRLQPQANAGSAPSGGRTPG